MSKKFPQVTQLYPDEKFGIIRIRIAKYLGQLPAAIDSMAWSDVCAVLDVMRADHVIGNIVE